MYSKNPCSCIKLRESFCIDGMYISLSLVQQKCSFQQQQKLFIAEHGRDRGICPPSYESVKHNADAEI